MSEVQALPEQPQASKRYRSQVRVAQIGIVLVVGFLTVGLPLLMLFGDRILAALNYLADATVRTFPH